MPRLARFALLDRLKLRAKLASAFLCLSLLIGICGASGLVFVYGIGATLSVFADVTSPLLGQTVVLVDNAQRMRSVFLDAVSKEDQPDLGGRRGAGRARSGCRPGHGKAASSCSTRPELPVRLGEIRAAAERILPRPAHHAGRAHAAAHRIAHGAGSPDAVRGRPAGLRFLAADDYRARRSGDVADARSGRTAYFRRHRDGRRIERPCSRTR